MASRTGAASQNASLPDLRTLPTLNQPFRFVCAVVISLGTSVGAAFATQSPDALTWTAEQNKAVLMARRGDTAPALKILDRLHRDHPNELGIANDILVVTAWTGDNLAVIKLFGALPAGPHPDYVLEAAAESDRALKRPAEALALYRQGLRQSPDNTLFTAGAIRCLADFGEVAAAIATAETDSQQGLGSGLSCLIQEG